MKQKEGNCTNTRGDTLSRAFKRMLYLERSNPLGYVLGLIYWAGVDSVMCSDWLSMVLNSRLSGCCMCLYAAPLWLCVGITTCFVALCWPLVAMCWHCNLFCGPELLSSSNTWAARICRIDTWMNGFLYGPDASLGAGSLPRMGTRPL